MVDMMTEREQLRQKIARDMNLVNSASDLAKEVEGRKSFMAKMEEDLNLSWGTILSLDESSAQLTASWDEKTTELNLAKEEIEMLKAELHDMTVYDGKQLSLGFDLA